jgi:ATP-dependent DNA helicase RecG
MDTNVLVELIAAGESQTLEFKIAAPRPTDLAERVCGFANSATGGMLVLGVRDGTWEIVGLKAPHEAVDVVIQAARYCQPSVMVTPQVLELDKKKLVVARIAPNDGRLYQAKGLYWLRRGTHTAPMETGELVQFLYRQGLLDWETRPVELASLTDLDMERVQLYRQQLAALTLRPARLTDPVELLVKLKCAVAGPEGVVRPTNAGLLLFGHSPREFLTQAEVVATYYQDASGVRGYTDRKILAGRVDEQIDRAAEYLRLWTPVAGRVEGFHRVDEPALPLEALREAVVNAVVHRDYSLSGTAVRIFYYPDRVEIYNPGVLLPGVSLAALREGKAPSQPRNPVIASVLRDMPGGYMERVGSGISFMLSQTRVLGWPAPEFKEQGEFVVIFRRKAVGAEEPAAAVGSSLAQAEEGKTIAKPTPLVAAERQALALQQVREVGFITHKLYRELTGASETTAIRDLDGLVARGALRRLGKGPSRRYVI